MCGDHTDPLRARSLPTRAADVTPSPHAVKNQTERLKWLCGRGFDDVKVEVEQACFRPECRRGKPVIGELAKGIYIASGHSVWGICNGPGTGKCMVRTTHSLFNDGRLTLCPGGTHPGWHSHRGKYSLTCTMKLIVYICVMIYVSPDRKGCVLSIRATPLIGACRPLRSIVQGPH